MGIHIFLQLRKQKSPQMRMLQTNLKKLNLFWSETESQIKEYAPGFEKLDSEKSIRSILVSGIGFAFLSWIGLFFEFVLMLSLRYLAVKRIEIRLFDSDLVEKELDVRKSREIVDQIMQS